MTVNPRHHNIRPVDESTSAETGQHTLYEFFTPVPKPCPGIVYTVTTKEDAQIDLTKGMQNRMLDTNSVLKRERLSSTTTTKEDAQINRNKEAPKSTIRVNPGSSHLGRHAQISSENRASSIQHIPVYTDMEYVRPVCPNKKTLTGKALVFHQVKDCVRSLTKVIIDADIRLTETSTKYIAELNYVRMKSKEVISKLTDRSEMWINLDEKKMKDKDSQHRKFGCYLRQIKDLQQRRTVFEERAQKIFQVKKKVKKKEQKKDEIKLKMEEELPYVRGTSLRNLLSVFCPK